jgi:hypothetical protein
MLVLCGVAAGDVEERALCECPRRAEAAKAVCGCTKKSGSVVWGFCFLIGARPLMMDPQSLNSTSTRSTRLFRAMQKQARALSHIKHPHLI